MKNEAAVALGKLGGSVRNASKGFGTPEVLAKALATRRKNRAPRETQPHKRLRKSRKPKPFDLEAEVASLRQTIAHLPTLNS